MYKERLNGVKEYTSTVEEFAGLNERVRCSENEFADMFNMSSDNYPLLSPRRPRAVMYESTNKITALINKEALIWGEISGGYHRVYVNGYEMKDFRSTQTSAERQFISMGAYLVVFPDKKFINLKNTEDYGSLGNKYENKELGPISDGLDAQRIILTPCTIDGSAISAKTTGTEPPEEPKSGDVWADTSGDKTAFKKWDEGTKQWVAMSTTYVKITRSDMPQGFSKWDAVSVSGLVNPYTWDSKWVEGDDRLKKQVDSLNADGVILYDVGSNYIIVAGIIDRQCYIVSESAHVVIERKVPDMDFIVECNNRLWGCKYGLVGDKVVNEIYCCRQGDFKNWYAYLGVSTDSYAVTVGSEGGFTGAAVYNKNPIFFKQDCMHQIYGSSPSSFQLVTINCEGVEKGQGDSVCVADNVLYYKGPTGFFAYTGALPQKISRNLSNVRFGHVIAEGVGDKVYFACGEKNGYKTIYVYDTYFGLWHKEDVRAVKAFSRDGHMLYMLAYEDSKSTIESVTGDTDVAFKIQKDEYPQYESAVQWAAESSDIGYSDANMKYIAKLTVRAKLSPGARMSVSVSYDSEPFIPMGEIVSQEGVHTQSLSFTPGRCEFFRYRIEGCGECRIISVKKRIIQGSDRP